MAEISSDVFDILYPSPISLTRMASITWATELWRFKIRYHREHNTLYQLDFRTNIPLNDIPYTLPSSIVDMLGCYIKSMGFSIYDWLKRMSKCIDIDNILTYFEDFACDLDGTVDDVETAKRIIYCNRFSSEVRFRIACEYCLQSDVIRLWPSVSTSMANTMAFQKVCFSNETKLCYWIFYLRGELHTIHGIDERIINTRCVNNRSTVEYIWKNCSNKESREEIIKLLVSDYPKLFVRYLLTRLNEDEFVNFTRCDGLKLIISLLEKNFLDCVIPTWLYINDNITLNGLTDLISNFLENETCSNFKNGDEYETVVKIYSDVWLNTPYHSKYSLLRRLPFLHKAYNRFGKVSSSARPNRKYNFLMVLLSDLENSCLCATRLVLWFINWRSLIEGSKLKNLYPLMYLCLGNENYIERFKQVIRDDESIERHWIGLLEQACFKELTDFFNFIYSDDRTIKDIKRRLLKMNFLVRDSILGEAHFREAQLMKEFIDSAFDDAGEVAKFKNLLLTSPSTKKILTNLNSDLLSLVMNFVDTLAPSKDVESWLKKFLKDIYTRKCKSAGSQSSESNEKISAFMLWCLRE